MPVTLRAVFATAMALPPFCSPKEALQGNKVVPLSGMNSYWANNSTEGRVAQQPEGLHRYPTPALPASREGEMRSLPPACGGIEGVASIGPRGRSARPGHRSG